MGRPTKEERRRDYLDIGASIVNDAARSRSDDAGLALAHVRLADVAERAGVTKGALYHVWSSQEAYWAELLEHLMAENRLRGVQHVLSLTDLLVESSEETPTLREYANAIFEFFRDDSSYFTRISLYAYLGDERVRRALDQELRSSLEGAAEFVTVGLESLGRRIRPGYHVTDLCVAVFALLDGLCLEYRVDPTRVPDMDIDGTRWTMFALGAHALVVAYTFEVGR